LPPLCELPPEAAMYAIAKGEKPGPELPDKFSKEARDFVKMCLIRDPDQRPSAYQLLKHEFLKQIDSSGQIQGKIVVKTLNKESMATGSNNNPCPSSDIDKSKDSKAASSDLETKKSNNFLDENISISSEILRNNH